MKQRGFTLIELAVAMVITAIVAIMGYGAINQALSHRTSLEAQSARLLDVQKAMRVLEQDIELAQPRPVRNLIGDGYEAAMIAPDSSTTSISTTAKGGTSGSEATPVLTLTRGGWSNPAGITRTELQRVAYYVVDGKLMRIYRPVLDATSATEPVRRELLGKVSGLSVRFMDASRQWRTMWPLTALNVEAQQQQLRARPIAVEVTVTLEDWGTLVRLYEVGG